jgi:hypothetical protein
LVLLTAANLVQGELLHSFLAVVAVQKELQNLVHCRSLRDQQALVLGL